MGCCVVLCCVCHLVSFCIFRYPMVLLTYLSLCCGLRKWRNQWMYSLSWQTRRWNKVESTLWRLCSSIAMLSVCRTQSKCGCKLQEPPVAPGHQNVEWVNVKTAVRCSVVLWHRVACCLCVQTVTVSHTGTVGLYILLNVVGLLPTYLLSFPIDICPDITTHNTGATASSCFPCSPGLFLLCLKVTHSTFCC